MARRAFVLLALISSLSGTLGCKSRGSFLDVQNQQHDATQTIPGPSPAQNHSPATNMTATFRFDVCPGRTSWLLVFREDNTWQWVMRVDIGQGVLAYGRYVLCDDHVILIRDGGDVRPWQSLIRYFWRGERRDALVSEDATMVFSKLTELVSP